MTTTINVNPARKFSEHHEIKLYLDGGRFDSEDVSRVVHQLVQLTGADLVNVDVRGLGTLVADLIKVNSAPLVYDVFEYRGKV